MDLSIVVPIYNEQGNLLELYKRLSSTCALCTNKYEIIFVHDGGKDASIVMIKQYAKEDNRIKYIDFSRNFGHQIAITAGIEKATGNAVVVIDGDLQDPPELIEAMYYKMHEGYEVVYAKRKKREGESFMKKLTAKMFYRTLQKITSIDIPVDTGDYRIMHRKVVDVLNQMPERHKYIRGQISWIGFNQTFVEYDRDERLSGETKFTYRKMMKFALDGITSFSTAPLKFATISGFVVSAIAFLLILYSLYSKFFGENTASGWTSLMISVLFIGGIQLLGIGIIGEYIGRINEDIKKRPLYIVKDTNITNEL